MSNSIFSSSWHMVADLKPILRGHIEIHRHKYRNQPVYVLQDHASGRCHRFNRSAYEVLGRLNGNDTVSNIWDKTNELLGDDAPTQDEVIHLLAKLHSADLLQANTLPDSEEIFSRYKNQRSAKLKQSLLNPLALKFSICDPDRFLDKLLPLAKKLFTRISAVVCICTIFIAILLAVMHWDKLVLNSTDRLFEPSNLLLLLFTYPVVKFFHEIGHALATKHWGGEVHDVGISLLVFMPVPYVDATAAWAFPEKSKRMLVGAMGIIVELFLSSLALVVWLNVEPGIVSSIAFNIVLIGSISTLFFNGNPLLKFDGYYVFQDAIEIPNLATRSKNYIAYLVKHYAFDIKHVNSPVAVDGERRWFVFYALTSSIYRWFILFFIALLIAKKFFIIGVMLVTLVLFTQIIKPLWKQISFLVSSPILQDKRQRAGIITSTALIFALSIIFLLPVPHWTRAEGVIWPAQESQIRLEVDGFVKELFAEKGQQVKRGDPILRLENIQLRTKVKVTDAQLKELKARYASIVFDKHAQAKILQEEISALEAELASIKNQLKSLIIHSPTDGYFVLADAKDIQGRYFNKGALVAHIVNQKETTALVAVTQGDVGAVRQATHGVGVRLAQRIENIHNAKISREVPAASNKLPSKALGVMGGGRITVNDVEGLTSREPLFLFELTLSEKVKTNFGERVYVRFDHGRQPLAQQWYRASRQLFLRNFNV